MKKTYILALIALSSLYFMGCDNHTNKSTQETNETILYVYEKTVSCQEGEAIMPKQCLQVKYNRLSSQWEPLYENIEGFNYEESYRYKLKVKMEKINEPMQDSSDTRMILIKVLNKTLIENGVKYEY